MFYDLKCIAKKNGDKVNIGWMAIDNRAKDNCYEGSGRSELVDYKELSGYELVKIVKNRYNSGVHYTVNEDTFWKIINTIDPLNKIPKPKILK